MCFWMPVYMHYRMVVISIPWNSTPSYLHFKQIALAHMELVLWGVKDAGKETSCINPRVVIQVWTRALEVHKVEQKGEQDIQK